MAVANSLRKPQEKKNAQLVSFQSNGMTVELSPQIVRDYLVSGDKERVSLPACGKRRTRPTRSRRMITCRAACGTAANAIPPSRR